MPQRRAIRRKLAEIEKAGAEAGAPQKERAKYTPNRIL
jgi:hypothetical protein